MKNVKPKLVLSMDVNIALVYIAHVGFLAIHSLSITSIHSIV